jgi:hypothetical protein
MSRRVLVTLVVALVGFRPMAGGTRESWDDPSLTNRNWYQFVMGQDQPMPWLPSGGVEDSGHVTVQLAQLPFIQGGYYPAYTVGLYGRDPDQEIDLTQDRWLRFSLKLEPGASLAGGRIVFFIGEWLAATNQVMFGFRHDLQAGIGEWTENSLLVGDPTLWSEISRVGSRKLPIDLFRWPQQYGLAIISPTSGSFRGMLHLDHFALEPESTPLRIDRPVQDLTVSEHGRATFEVGASCNTPIAYEWFQNGALIGDARSPRLTIDPVALSNAGTIRVEVFTLTSPFQTEISEARLEVQPDRTPLRLVEARGVGGSINEVRVRYDEPVDQASAENLDSYQISGLAIARAELATDGVKVRLSTSQQTTGVEYALRVVGVKSAAVPPTVLTTNRVFTSRVTYRDEVVQDGPDLYFGLSEAGGSQAYDLVGKDPTYVGTYSRFIGLQADRLVPGAPDLAASFAPERGDAVWFNTDSAFVNSEGPFEDKTIEFWFEAKRLPSIDPANSLPRRMVLWEQGGTTRGVAIYLSGWQRNAEPTEAELVFHARNNANDDGAVNTPWGLPTHGAPLRVSTTVRAGTSYHVVLVLDGDPSGAFQGRLDGYVNGRRVETPTGENLGVGLLHAHPDKAALGGVNQGAALLEGSAGDPGTADRFDGVLDELAIYNRMLPEDRIQVHYEAGLLEVPLEVPSRKIVITTVRTHGGTLTLEWTGGGRLQRASRVNGDYETIPDSASPYTEAIDPKAARFYRVIGP